jgi:hypothetical protein
METAERRKEVFEMKSRSGAATRNPCTYVFQSAFAFSHSGHSQPILGPSSSGMKGKKKDEDLWVLHSEQE